jgi:hypothetical protein
MRAGFLGVLVLGVVFATGCGAAARQAAPVASHAVAPTAFVTRNATQAAGTPVVARGKTGVSLRPVPGGTFGLLLVIKNKTHRQLMLEDVRAVVPRGSSVRQLGTHLAPFFQCKPYCSRHAVMHGPFGVQRPRVLHVRPLTSAQAQLNFAFAGCGALQTASTAPITRAIVTYRDPLGTVFHQTIALDSAQLDLRSSELIACPA